MEHLKKSQAEFLSLAKKTQVQNYAQAPIVIKRGKGCQVEDADGKKYLDLTAGVAVLSLGHCHPKLVKAIADQAAELMHVSNVFYNDRAIELAQKLNERIGYQRTFFCNSGTEATEALLKLARRYHFNRGETKRIGFVATHRAFHGRSLGALSVTGQEKYHEGMKPLIEPVTFVDFNESAQLDKAIDDTTAAVILEPIQAEGGIFVGTAQYFQTARKLCDERGVLLLIDEIQTGYGRTGTFLAQEWLGIRGDAVSLAKGMGGGFPVGAIALDEKFAEGMPKGSHGSTFGGNALACAAALAVLQVIEEEFLVRHAAEKGEWCGAQLMDLKKKIPQIIEVRGRGLLWGVELETQAQALAAQVALQQLGVLVTVVGGMVLRISPALTVTRAELQEGLRALEKVLKVNQETVS